MAQVFEAPPLANYELLDSGGGEKLERFAGVTLRRPDPQALWAKARTDAEWARADLSFVRESDRGGRWEPGPNLPKRARGREAQWHLEHGGARLVIRPTPFKHVGLFPEQVANWTLVGEVIGEFEESRPRLLNLFGYTGAASVLAAKAGFDVTHVDASKASITWAVDNAEASGLGRGGMRVVCEDALRFARREARRGSRYSVILLDPPHYGRGPKGEVWRLEDHLAELVDIAGLLSADQALIVLSTYAVGYSPLAFERILQDLEGGTVEAGELAIPEGHGTGRYLPAGFCARWARGVSHDAVQVADEAP